MQYEVSPGRMVISNKTRYPAGSLVPELPDHASLEAAGAIRPVSGGPPPRPEPVSAPILAAPHAGFDSSVPSSISGIPLRFLSDCLATVDDLDELHAMYEVETRKGGLDKIEERIGELEVAS